MIRLHLSQLRTLFLILVTAGSLAACSTLQSVDTFNKREAAAYSLAGAVADMTTATLQAGKISLSDAGKVQQTLAATIAGLDAAATLHTTNPAGAEANLTSLLAALQALQAYLTAQGAK